MEHHPQVVLQELRVDLLQVQYQTLADLVVEVIVPLTLYKDGLIRLVVVVVLMEMMVEVLSLSMVAEAAAVLVVLVLLNLAPLCGNGGTGYDLTNFFSELTGDGHNGTDKIAGGGGGGQSRYADGGIYSSSSSGSGNDGGGGGGGFANSGNGYDAAANTGAGGGGAAGTRGAAGGAGGSGIVYLKYTSETQLVGNWTGTASDHTVTSYDQSVAGGTKRTWIHKIIGDGALSLL